jgi:putative NADPH-quinone reductase
MPAGHRSPLTDSLCATLAARAAETLSAAGHEVVFFEDLYQEDFEAELTYGRGTAKLLPPAI